MNLLAIIAGLTVSVGSALQPRTSATATTGDELRVMTFNIRYGTAGDGPDRWTERREMVYDVIRQHRPDVVGLQEALRFQLDEIRAAVPGYGEIGVAREDGKQKGEYSAILYREDRLKVADSGTFWLSDTPEVVGSTTWGNKLTRICTWARFEDRAGGGVFWMYNSHLDHQSQRSRERSVELLAQRIAAGREKADGPVIVTGDFNAGEDNPAVTYLVGGALKGSGVKIQGSEKPTTRPMVGDGPRDVEGDRLGLATRPALDAKARLVDTFRALHPDAKEFGTFHGFKGSRTGDKIDYILVSQGVKTLEAEIIHDNRDGRYPSDHYPVCAILRLRSVP